MGVGVVVATANTGDTTSWLLFVLFDDDTVISLTSENDPSEPLWLSEELAGMHYQLWIPLAVGSR